MLDVGCKWRLSYLPTSQFNAQRKLPAGDSKSHQSARKALSDPGGHEHILTNMEVQE